ncbi:LPXTG cell wall anchor domain-containing protein, partial [Clostridium perfringens]
LTNTQEFEISKDTYSGGFSTITNTKKSAMPLTGSTQLIVTVLAGAVLIVSSGVYYRKRKMN